MRRLGLAVLVLLLINCTYEDSQDPPGDPRAFDPVDALPDIEKFAGKNARLTSIKAWYVKSDGTLDLEADYKPRAEYEFVRKSAADDDKPVGTGTKRREYDEIEVDIHQPRWVTTKTVGGSGCDNKEGTFYDKGMTRGVGQTDASVKDDVADEPGCSFAKIWDKAVKEGADEDAVAIITYDRLGYEFEIKDLDIELYFDPKCKLETKDDRRSREYTEGGADSGARAKREKRRLEREKRKKEAELRKEKKKLERKRKYKLVE